MSTDREELQRMLETVNSELARRQGQQTEEKPGMWTRLGRGIQDFSEGLGVSGLKTYYGAKDLLGLGKESDAATLKAWQDAAGESWAGKAGEIGGDLAQLAIPGSAGVKVASKLPQAMRWAQGAKAGTRLAADVAGGAALGYTQLPEEGASRRENAAMMGAAGVGGAVLGKALKIAGTGIKGSPAAQRLKDVGIKLTPGQQNDLLMRVEKVMNLLPFTAKGVQRGRERAYNSLLRKTQRMADPNGRLFNNNPLIERLTPKEVNREIKAAFDDGYKRAWTSGQPLPLQAVQNMYTNVAAAAEKLSEGQLKAVYRVLDDVGPRLANPHADLNAIDVIIKEYKRLPGNNPKKVRLFNSILDKMRADLRAGLPKENQGLLKELDKRYAHYAALRNATTTSTAEKAGGLVTVDDLLSGVRQASSKQQRALNEGPFGSMLEDFVRARGVQHEPLLGTSRAIIKELPDVFQTRHAAAVLGGSAPGQKALRDLIKKYYTDAQRNWYSGARMGSAAYED